MDIQFTPYQIQCAREEFLERSKYYMEALYRISSTKKVSIQYNLETKEFVTSPGEETEMEKTIQGWIKQLQEECFQNAYKYPPEHPLNQN